MVCQLKAGAGHAAQRLPLKLAEDRLELTGIGASGEPFARHADCDKRADLQPAGKCGRARAELAHVRTPRLTAAIARTARGP